MTAESAQPPDPFPFLGVGLGTRLHSALSSARGIQKMVSFSVCVLDSIQTSNFSWGFAPKDKKKS